MNTAEAQVQIESASKVSVAYMPKATTPIKSRKESLVLKNTTNFKPIEFTEKHSKTETFNLDPTPGLPNLSTFELLLSSKEMKENVPNSVQFSAPDTIKPLAPRIKIWKKQMKPKVEKFSKITPLVIEAHTVEPVLESFKPLGLKYDKHVRRVGQEVFHQVHGKQRLILDHKVCPYCKNSVEKNKPFTFSYHVACYELMMRRSK